MGAPERELSQALARGTRRYRPNVPGAFGIELEYYHSDPAHLERRLAVSSPAGGEVVLQLPRPLGPTTVDGRVAAVSHNASFVKVAVGPGEHQLEVHWHQAKPERKRRSSHKPANRRHRSTAKPRRA